MSATDNTDPAQMIKAESLATTRDALDLNQMVLIGIVGKTGDPAAMIRMPNGAVAKVQRGDKLRGGTVLAVGNAGVHIQTLLGTKVLEMPRG